MTGPRPDGAESPSRAPGVLLGLGLGGLLDGIVMHQILQWHHMVSDVDGRDPTTLAGLEVNTMADGFFHLATWFLIAGASIVTVAQWRQGRLAPGWGFHLGGVVLGAGAFNLVEGLVDHQLLGVHHVRDDLGGPLAWDLGFLVLGALMVAAGVLIQRRSVRTARPASA